MYMLLLYTLNIPIEDLTLCISLFKQKTSNEHELIHDVDHPCRNHVCSKTYKQQSNRHGGRKAHTFDVCNKSVHTEWTVSIYLQCVLIIQAAG